MLKNFLSAAAIFLLTMYSIISLAGNNVVLLKSRIISTDNNFTQLMNEAVSPGEIFQENYYRLLQFNEILTDAQRQQLEGTGVKLLGYIPNNAYYVAIPTGFDLSVLQTFNPRTIINLQPQDKISNQLRNGNIDDRCRNKDGSLNFTIVYYSNLPPQAVKNELIVRGCSILESFDEFSQISVSINENAWTSIAACNFIKHVEPLFPSAPDDNKGRSLHRSNAVNTDYSAGRHYDGAGVTIALADDGEVGPHIDYQGRMINTFNTGPGGSHGDMTSGICMGAGNMDPVIKGMATGSQIYIYDIGTYPPDTLSDSYPQIVDAEQHYNDFGTVVISTSYSAGCNDYDAFASMTDRIMHDLPMVCPVWSGGNNQGADCGYGAGGQWGNITGGFKQGKNPIAVANLDAHQIIDNTSSHGPASDGRLKPDISANGKDQMSIAQDNTFQVGGGTSAACPSIAGLTAQCYQAYKEITGEPNPDAALIKGCLLNAAWDIGTAGPDYAFGYGRVDALRSIQTIEEQRYIVDSTVQGGSKSHTIFVPFNTKQVKVMLIWNDPEGDANALKALVNNLDLVVTNPSLQSFNPWVLDPTPIATNLAQPAARRIDTLNNIEQVTIDNPASGNYTVTVGGTSVPFGPQKYFIVYEFWNDNITVTYPIGGEGFVPSETEVIRWNAFSTTGTFDLEYSTDNGTSWNSMGSVPGTERQFDWTIPNIVSGNCLVRVSRGGIYDVSDSKFSIINDPQNLQVVWACVDSIKLSWNAVAGAAGYEVSRLGSMYMDSTGTSSINEIVLQGISVTDTSWFSVRALTTGAKGRRAIAIQKLPGLLSCSLAQDLALNSIIPASGNFYDCGTGLDSVEITAHITNSGFNSASGFDLSYSINSGNPVTESFPGVLNFGQSTDYTFTTRADLSAGGVFDIDVEIIFVGDQFQANNILTSQISVALAAPAPVTEDFQGLVFPPLYWSTINSNANDTWTQVQGITGSNGVSTNAAVFDNCGYNANGAEDELVTQLFDVSGISFPMLSFDVAYRAWNGYTDALRIDVSTNCGVSFIPSGYYKESPQLTTVAAGTGCFTPTSAVQWRTDTVDLSAFSGNNVILKFVNIGGFGNLLFIDNVNVKNNYVLTAHNPDSNVPQINVYPNPSAGIFTIEMKDIPGAALNLKVIDASGRTVMETQLSNSSRLQSSVDLSNEKSGIYYLQVLTAQKIYYMMLTKL